jgi:hypothetical protein
VAGNVDHADLSSGRQIEPGEAEIDRQLPLFFLGEPVWIDAGQRFNQRRFAVVDMSRGADDIRRRLSLKVVVGRLAGNSDAPVGMR